MNGKVLIVDDARSVREMFRALLDSEQYEVAVAESGEQALEIIPDFQPDLILLDVNMPRVDGFMSAKVIRALLGDTMVPIIFLKATDDRFDSELAFEVGGDGFIHKQPLDYEDFLANVKRWITARQHNETVKTRASIETLSQMIVTLAHHINNALAVIQGFIQITDPTNLDHVKRLMDALTKQTARIQAVVQSLKEMADEKDVNITTYYLEGTKMIDIAHRLEEKLHRLETGSTVEKNS